MNFIPGVIFTTALIVFIVIHVIILSSLRLYNFDIFTLNVIKVLFVFSFVLSFFHRVLGQR